MFYVWVLGGLFLFLLLDHAADDGARNPAILVAKGDNDFFFGKRGEVFVPREKVEVAV